MTKTNSSKKKKRTPLSANEKLSITSMVLQNATVLRRQTIAALLNPGLDIDYECRYPTSITINDYKRMFDREGIAARVVSIYPEECWSLPPTIFETESTDVTDFEKAWADLQRERRVYQYLQRADVISGIGEFGLLLLGIDDGLTLDKPVVGLNSKGEKEGKSQYKLLYLKPFDQSGVTIDTKEKDLASPRYGLPLLYTIKLEDPAKTSASRDIKVHWTRVLHLADGRLSSDTLGTPRMKNVYNRLLDVRKITAGSGEMFWRGGYPGMNFEIDPEVASQWDTAAKDSFKEEIKDYADGMQRYLALAGVKAHSMAPQIADPRGHIETQVGQIALALGVPLRVFMGSEEGKLASGQDAKAWHKRVAKRRVEYVMPMIIRLFIDRMIIFGILPQPALYNAKWPDLEAPSDLDKAKVALTVTEAFAKYVAGEVDTLMGPKEYLMEVHGLTEEQAKMVEKGSSDRVIETEGTEKTKPAKKKITKK